MDFGVTKKAESHDQIYGEWTPIEPKESEDSPSPINILEEITKSDLENEEENEEFTEVETEAKPKKRSVFKGLYFQSSVRVSKNVKIFS